MMFAHVEDQKRLAFPGQRGRCSTCNGDVVAQCGGLRIWHWAHEVDDCDPWAEPESEWHLGWKKHAPVDRTEIVVEHEGVKHRADVLCANGAVLELQAGPITAEKVRVREAFYGHMAWLFRVNWADRLHYGKRGFWWKGAGGVAQTFAARHVFWHFEEEDIVQGVKLSLTESNRVLGRAVKTYKRAQFAEFIATGKLTT